MREGRPGAEGLPARSAPETSHDVPHCGTHRTERGPVGPSLADDLRALRRARDAETAEHLRRAEYDRDYSRRRRDEQRRAGR